MDKKQVSYSFVSIVFLGNKSELNSLQAFISQRGHFTIYIQTCIVELSRRGLLDGQKTSKLQFCEHCVFGYYLYVDYH